MTPEEQRIAIADACGFRGIRMSKRWEVSDPPEDACILCGELEQRGVDIIPDYLNDANATLQLCDRLAAKGWNCELSQGTDKTWECTFKRVASKDSPVGTLTFDHDTAYEIYYHPADTLPEAISGAFLHTIGKWKD